MEGFEMILCRTAPIPLDQKVVILRKGESVMKQSGLTEQILMVGKLMGNSTEDILKYGLKEPVPQSQGSEDVLAIGKMLGNTPEDIARYGGK